MSCSTVPQLTVEHVEDKYRPLFHFTPKTAWMSNWRYGALVPTIQFRGAMALPRELKLFSTDEGIFASAAPYLKFLLSEKSLNQ